MSAAGQTAAKAEANDTLMPHPIGDGIDPEPIVAAIVRRSRSSFGWGMRSLEPPRRQAIHAVYAFCRVTDDIADSPTMPRDRQLELLDAWRDEIGAAYAGTARSAVGRSLARAAEDFDLPEAEFHSLIDGMAMDVDGPIVAPSMADLHLYTRRVAGSVGALSIRIFGARECAERQAFALSLADALQLVNILRDVEEDAEVGRVYLPVEPLKAHGLPVDDDAALVRDLASGHPAVPRVCATVAAEARKHFQTARAALPALERASVRPALMMMGVYEGYLDRMEARAHARDADTSRMPGWQKLARGLRYAYAFPDRAA